MPPAANAVPILVVDDDALNRDLLSRRLARLGYEVSVACNGKQALAMIGRHDYALVLLEQRMPEMSGLEVLAQLRQSNAADDLPVIMLTANDDPSDVVSALDGGANDYVVKPVDFAILRARISTQLLRSEAQAVLLRSKQELEGIVDQRTAALQASEARYRTLYDDNPSILLTVDRGKKIVAMNKFGFGYLGFSEADVVGKHIGQLLPENARMTISQRLDQCFHAPGKVQRWETRMARNVSAPIPVRISARGALDAKGGAIALLVCEDVSELHRLTTQLSYEMTHDAATGLINQFRLEQEINNLAAGAGPGPDAVTHALCVIKIDQFRLINNALGRPGAVELLRRVADSLQANPASHLVGRLYSGQLVVLLKRCSIEAARSAAEQFLAAIDVIDFRCGSEAISVTASIGVRAFQCGEADAGDLLHDAESACHVAREAGGDQIQVFDRAIDPKVLHRSELEWVVRTKRALEENRFALYAQSIATLSAPDDGGAHYEVLIRMLDDDDEMIPPVQFLQAAERHNLSARLDRWVVRNTLRWLAQHPQHVDNLELCSINLSGQSIGDDAFLAFLKDELQRSVVAPQKICFEITETAAIANLSAANQFISELNGIGARFALDDFGSGLSSFAYLKNLPVDFVKIDGIFIRKIASDPINLAIVHSINEIAHAMGKKTIAEFVDSAETLDALRDIGVDLAQGYFIDEPAPIASKAAPA